MSEQRKWAIFGVWSLSVVTLIGLTIPDLRFKNIYLNPESIRTLIFGGILLLAWRGSECIEQGKFPKKITNKIKYLLK